MSQCPCSSVPSSAVNTDCESKRGMHNQSMLPSSETSAAVRMSDSRAYFSSGVWVGLLMVPTLFTGQRP